MSSSALTNREIETLKKICRLYNAGNGIRNQRINAIIKHGVALTEKETRIIKLICKEKTSAEIAKSLGIGLRGVEKIRTEIYKKTGAKTIAGVVKFAIKQHLI